MRIKNSHRGDTMIEVLFAIAVFALISVLSIIVMNSGVATVEATLELSMARNEIDAQSEALRFIHNSFLSERENVNNKAGQPYAEIWKRLKSIMNEPGGDAILPLSIDNCAIRYEDGGKDSIFSRNTMILNTRNINPDNPSVTIIKASKPQFQPAPLNPRILYGNDDDTNLVEGATNVYRVEGLWIIPIKSEKKDASTGNPEFYDFHIYTCWFAPGRERPTTIGTIMRLYNPELIEVGK